MLLRIFYLIIAMLVTAHSGAVVASEPVWTGKVLSYLNAADESDFDLAALRKFLDHLSLKAAKLPDFVRWPGTEYGYTITNRLSLHETIAMVHMETDSDATLALFVKNKEWKVSKITNITFQPYPYLLSKIKIIPIDLNGDGIRDYFIRFIGGATGPFPKSYDCPVISSTDQRGEISDGCFKQAAAAEERDYIETKFKGKHLMLSHLVDIDGDGKYELVVTSILAPIDMATSTFWPDIYAVVNNHYQLESNDLAFKKYYEALYPIVVKKLEYEPSMSGLKAMKRKILALLNKQR